MGAAAPRLIDISPLLAPGAEVFPGDAPLAYEWTSALERGDAVNLGRLSLSAHSGAHVDAPLHVAAGGLDIAALPLDVFWGPAVVLDWSGRGAIDLEGLETMEWSGVERALFRTRVRGERLSYRPGFAAFTPAGARFLAERGVRLVGVDTPSVDPLESAELPAHRELARWGVAILECLELGEAEPGAYELAALPLRISGAEGSPVRAALRALG